MKEHLSHQLQSFLQKENNNNRFLHVHVSKHSVTEELTSSSQTVQGNNHSVLSYIRSNLITGEVWQHSV